MKTVIALWFSLLLICVFAAPQTVKDSKASDEAEPSPKAGPVQVASDEWLGYIRISGLIEVEAGIQKVDFSDPMAEDEDVRDVDLATVELVVDVKIAEHVDGHVLFLYEEDEISVDEGFITLKGSESFPAYLIAGRQYMPFGCLDTHFVTDPNTLLLGETNEGAIVAGYRFGGEKVDVSAGVFNGRAKKSGDENAIDSFIAGIAVQPFESMHFGVSYTSNLAGSDALSKVLTDPDNLESLIGGWSAFVGVKFLERFKLIGEYVGALDHFKAGELYDTADAKSRKPSAWNMELVAAIFDGLELAVRYGGSDDGGADFLPESQYGAVLNWGCFGNTNLAIEYLHGKFADDVKETDSLIVQFAIRF